MSLITIKQLIETSLPSNNQIPITVLVNLLKALADDWYSLGLTEENFTTVLLNKLNGIAAGAEVNVQTDWNQTNTGSDDFLKNKPNVVDVLLQGKTLQAFDINGGSSGSLTSQGFSSVYRTNSGDGTDYVDFTFPTVGTDQYQVLVEYYTTGTVDGNNEWTGMAVRLKTSTGFQLVIKEYDGEVQTIFFIITLIKHL